MSTSNGDGKRKEGKGDTHHDRKTGTDAPYRIELYQSTDTGDDHTVLDEHSAHRTIQSYRTGKDHNWSNVADEHCQDMLKTKWECFTDGHSTVKLVEIFY